MKGHEAAVCGLNPPLSHIRSLLLSKGSAWQPASDQQKTTGRTRKRPYSLFLANRPLLPAGVLSRVSEMRTNYVDDETMEWYLMTPQERWRESEKLWTFYLSVGGSLDPEPDSQSPFNDAYASCQMPSHGRTSVRVVRRSGV